MFWIVSFQDVQTPAGAIHDLQIVFILQNVVNLLQMTQLCLNMTNVYK